MSAHSAPCFLALAALLLTDRAAAAAGVVFADVAADEPQEEGLADALYEAAYTLTAFGLAAGAIRYVQLRHAEHVKPRSRPRKDYEASCSTGRVSKSSPSSGRSSGAASAAGKAAPRAAALAADGLGRGARVGDHNAIIEAARGDRRWELPSLLDAAFARLAPRACAERQRQFVQSTLRICASRRLFAEALTIFDQMVAQYGLMDSPDMWSVLLYCAVESHDLRRCKEFAAKLLESAIPTGNDFVNIVRYAAASHDVAEFRHIVVNLRDRGFVLDNISCNRSLAACVANKALMLADVIVESPAVTAQLDLVGYNTFMKCCTQARDSSRCFSTYDKMRAAGLMPSEVSYGIILDACNISSDVDRAKMFFCELRESGLRPNAIHYTSFIRVLAGSGLLDEADKLLEEMLQSSDTHPDLVTFSTLIKAHADHGNVKGAMRALERMIAQGVKPDAIIFNVVLSACSASRMDTAVIMHVYRRLEQHGMKTTNTSLSVLLKAFARNQDWNASLGVLAEATGRWQLRPEARLFAQVAQACRNANGSGQTILECYVAMIKSAMHAGSPVDMAGSSRLMRLCASSGRESAVAIHDGLVRSGGVASTLELEPLLRNALSAPSIEVVN